MLTVALGLWILTALAVPVLEKRWGVRGLRWGFSAAVLLQALVVVRSLTPVWTPEVVATTVLGLCIGGWLAEYVGVTTGLLFGPYAYTNRLRPQLGGIPLVVVSAYVGVLVPAWGIADVLVGGRRQAEFVIVSALVATIWDLLLDPILVSRGVWEWRTRGGYFGIPWRNYVGWFGVSATLTVVLQPGPLAPLPLLQLYTVAWLMQVVALLTIWRRRGPALVGGLIMGSIVLVTWLRF